MPVSAHVHPYRPPRVAGATGQSVVGRGGGERHLLQLEQHIVANKVPICKC